MHDISALTAQPTIELLAPAGSAAALHAAVRAGADAVYLGLDQFNARRGADNFTMPTFRKACEYAHLRGVRVYVAMNTMILPHEWKSAMEMARQAWRAGADAFIIQDIGLAAELKRTLPEARLHVSTQMNTHNAAGVAAAAALGASRLTLAREMNLDEIGELVALAKELDMEVETFAHGALCVCYSGQCLMSSIIGGRSANRGTCAQACRLPYELKNVAQRKSLPSPGEHLLSPKDLCAVDALGLLVDAGVASVKVEGRMKSPEYVAAVVGVYRAVLDRVLAAPAGARGEVKATQAEKNTLSEAFSRGFTTAYLTNERGNDIMSYQRPNNRGVAVGRVNKTDSEAVYLDPTKRLVKGDILEVWTGKGRAVVTVDDPKPDKKGLVRIPFGKIDRETRAIRYDDRVFRVRSAAAAFVDDELLPKVVVDGRVTLRLGEPALVEFWPAAGMVDEDGTLPLGAAEGNPVELARTKAVTAEEIRDHVDRLGSTPFELADLDVDMDEGVGLGFGALHQLRAAALEDLAAKMILPWAGRLIPKTEPREELERPFDNNRSEKPIVVAWATNPVCARNARRAGAEVVYVPALNYKRGEAQIAGQLSATADTAGYPKAAVLALPVVDHDLLFDADGTPLTREAKLDFDVWERVQEDKTIFAESWGSVVRALEAGAEVEVGPHIPVTNPLTLRTMVDLGVKRVWLSPELTLKQIEELSGAAEAKDTAEPTRPPVSLGITVVGAQELMITEHCLLMSQGPCNEECATCPRRKSPHFLNDRKDVDFPVVTDALGRSHLYNSVQLDIAHTIPQLLSAGVTAFMVDTTLMNGEEAAQAVGRVVHALDLARRGTGEVAKVNAATTGHLFRGVQ